MPDPFESSRRKLARANGNLTELKRQVTAFLEQKHLYTVFTEPHPNKPQHFICKMRLTREAPDSFSELTGYIADNLRAALDHALYGLAVASECKQAANAYFPFSKDSASFEANLKGRCKDVPKEIWPLLRSYQPYKGGSDLLWALNLVRIGDNHKIVVPVGGATLIDGIDIRSTGGFISMPYTPTWDRTKNEMELCTVGPEAKVHGNFKFAIYIEFGKIDTLEGKQVIPTVELFTDMTETILNEIEAEARKLGFIH